MSTSFSLDVQLETNNSIHCRDIIEILLQNSWNILKNEKITYLPFNDDDMFDWTVSNISANEFLKLADKKENVKELIGVELYWENTDVGGHLLLSSGTDFSFVWNINTIFLESELKIPDFNWYAEKTIKSLKQYYHVLDYKFNIVY